MPEHMSRQSALPASLRPDAWVQPAGALWETHVRQWPVAISGRPSSCSSFSKEQKWFGGQGLCVEQIEVTSSAAATLAAQPDASGHSPEPCAATTPSRG